MLKGVGGDGVSQKIYIVEDDASIRELESYALKSAGLKHWDLRTAGISSPKWRATCRI